MSGDPGRQHLENLLEGLLTQVGALRHLVAALLAQHELNSPNALQHLLTLVDLALNNASDPDAAFNDGVRQEVHTIVNYAHACANVVIENPS